MAAPLGNRLQNMLQAAVQSVQWTYSLFWQMCPQQGELVWGDGYYNGAIKTRKTIEPVEVTAKEASLQRSQQLRELYDSLSGGDTDQPARRPSASLSPEDLTESEWFYLICVSFSFPSGSGLPGKAYSKRHHVWLAGANESDSKTFSRAILAKSAGVQTVVCIPMLGGVVEFGTTERVEEDMGFVNHVKSFFTVLPPKPALSEHSTSNRHSPPLFAAEHPPVNANAAVDDDEEEAESDSEAETGQDRAELVQLESMSEDIRLGSPDDGSINDLDPYLNSDDPADRQRRAGLFRSESARRWPMLQQQEPLSSSGVELEAQPQVSGGSKLDELSPPEETHYSHTVSTILQNQPSHVAESASTVHSPHASLQSAFAKWTTPPDKNLHVTPDATSSSQRLLKYVLHTLHNKNSPKSPRDVTDASEMTRHDELGGGSHVLAERRRREKLNERFVILRSLVPFVTKMDKASILGDAIEYLKQLRDKIHDLETRNLHLLQASDQRPRSSGVTAVDRTRVDPPAPDKRKVRVVEGPDGGATAVAAAGITVQVSIIESDALVELECPYREGLLLDVMTTLRELRVEITTVQSSLNDSMFQAEMRAKVRDNGNGKRASIVEVKRAISQIIPQTLES